LFDATKPATLEIDVLDYALGACLSQPSLDGKLRLVAYYARKFLTAEVNYSTLDKELLAIVDALKHWKHYLEGVTHKIKVFSDYKNLRNFTTTKELNRRQLR
jgi:hypothetical protein